MQSKLTELNGLPLDNTKKKKKNTVYCSPSIYSTFLYDDMNLCGVSLITNPQRTKLCRF